MAEQENVQRMQDLYAAFGRGDIATILANCSEDIDWGTETTASEVPWYRIRRGREGVADFFSTLEREVDFRQFEPRVFAGAGDQVRVPVDIEYQLKKNGRGAYVGSLHEYTFRDGAVSRFRAYEDTAAVRDAWNS